MPKLPKCSSWRKALSSLVGALLCCFFVLLNPNPTRHLKLVANFDLSWDVTLYTWSNRLWHHHQQDLQDALPSIVSCCQETTRDYSRILLMEEYTWLRPRVSHSPILWTIIFSSPKRARILHPLLQKILRLRINPFYGTLEACKISFRVEMELSTISSSKSSMKSTSLFRQCYLYGHFYKFWRRK